MTPPTDLATPAPGPGLRGPNAVAAEAAERRPGLRGPNAVAAEAAEGRPGPLFELPPDLEAREPAEMRAGGRHDVRRMVARGHDAGISHRRFADIVAVLAPGDLLVVNTSATVPAAVDVLAADGTALRLHLSSRLPDGRWLVELRAPAGVTSVPFAGARAGDALRLAGGARAELVDAWEPAGHRLWVAVVDLGAPVDSYLAVHGTPVRYGHAGAAWPLTAYQTVYANESGSAEMPSAGRAFTPELVTALVARGMGIAPIVLHCGVSSPEAHELPAPEWFRVPAATARWVQTTRDGGGAVVAVGTSAVRALETVTDAEGRVHPGEGWTELVIGPERGVRLSTACSPDGTSPRPRTSGCWRRWPARPPAPLLRRGPRPRLSLARVRRPLPAAAVTGRPSRPVST